MTRARGGSSPPRRTFPSMVAAGQGVNLAEIKAVSDGFPLRGRIRIADAIDAPEREVQGGPKAGSAWIAVALAGRLGLKVGDTLNVGRARLTVAAIIKREPDSVLDTRHRPRVLCTTPTSPRRADPVAAA